MELPEINRAPSGACLGKDFDRGHAFKCFEEGIQALRREHKHTESMIFGLRQQMEMATSEMLGACQRMGSELTQCTALFNDVMKTSCSHPDQLQTDVSDCEDSTVNGAETRHNETQSRRAKVDTTIITKSFDTSAMVGMIGNPTAIEKTDTKPPKGLRPTTHTELLHEIGEKTKRRDARKAMVAELCRCYHARVPSKLVLIVHSAAFNNLCALITVAFVILVGIEADSHIRSVLDGYVTPKWIEPAANFFNCCFVAEVTLRLLADGEHYFFTKDWGWNAFDMLCAILSVIDMVAQTGGIAFMRVLRSLKVAQTVRMVRLLRMLDDLRLIVAATLASLVSLLWSLLFLVMVIYLAAVAFVDAAASYVEDRNASNIREDINNYYTSLPKAMYTLLMCTTGGMDWSDGAAPMWHFGWFYGCAFLCYILFCLLGILNVITSVFVDKALNVKSHDRDYAVSQELRAMQEDIEDTMELFSTLVEAGGEITVQALEELLLREHVMAHFSSLGMEISDPEFVSRALGDTDAGCVDIRSFVHGCISLRGPARQTDIISILSRVQKLESMIVKFFEESVKDFKLVAELAAKARIPNTSDKNRLQYENTALASNKCSLDGLQEMLPAMGQQIHDFEARLADLEIYRAVEALVDRKS